MSTTKALHPQGWVAMVWDKGPAHRPCWGLFLQNPNQKDPQRLRLTHPRPGICLSWGAHRRDGQEWEGAPTLGGPARWSGSYSAAAAAD